MEVMMGKVELRIEVDSDLLAQAEAEGVAPSAALEEGIRAALSRAAGDRPDNPGLAADAARQWAEENVEAIRAHRERIEEYGVFGDDLRTW